MGTVFVDFSHHNCDCGILQVERDDSAVFQRLLSIRDSLPSHNDFYTVMSVHIVYPINSNPLAKSQDTCIGIKFARCTTTH